MGESRTRYLWKNDWGCSLRGGGGGRDIGVCVMGGCAWLRKKMSKDYSVRVRQWQG